MQREQIYESDCLATPMLSILVQLGVPAFPLLPLQMLDILLRPHFQLYPFPRPQDLALQVKAAALLRLVGIE